MERNVEGGTARGALCEARGRRAEMSAGLLALAPVWPPVVGYQDRKCRVSAQPSLVHFPTYDPLPSHPWRGNVSGFALDTSDRSSSHRVFCFHPSPNLTDYGASRAASRNYPATRYCQDGVVSSPPRNSVPPAGGAEREDVQSTTSQLGTGRSGRRV